MTVFLAVFGLIAGIFSALAGIIGAFVALVDHFAGRGPGVAQRLISGGLILAGAAGIAAYVALRPWEILA